MDFLDNCTYRIKHLTRYIYPDTVNQSFSEVRLSPIHSSRQSCLSSNLTIEPAPNNLAKREDFFGNTVHRFSIFKPHKELEICCESEVKLQIGMHDFYYMQGETNWIDYKSVLSENSNGLLDVTQFQLESPFISSSSNEIGEFVHPIFRKEAKTLDAVRLLMSSIYHQFEFKAGVTNISTPIHEVLKSRKGVCQDFAHIAIASLRHMGLAAKYVSGYIETIAPKGTVKLVGADASHAWVGVYIPEFGWVEFDPTNNIFVESKHIALAYGRDYGDVAPVKGVVYSDGEQQMETSVDVERVQ